jgi:stage III sporulation protein SpoIIIAA
MDDAGYTVLAPPPPPPPTRSRTSEFDNFENFTPDVSRADDDTIGSMPLASAAAVDNNDASQSRRHVELTDLPALARVTARAEISFLLEAVLPTSIRTALLCHPQFDLDSLEEIFLHAGMDIEARCSARAAGGGAWCSFVLRLPPPTEANIKFIASRVGPFGDDGRACVPGTLHRVSCFMGRTGGVLGVTIRVGRFVPNAARALRPFLFGNHGRGRGRGKVASAGGKGPSMLLLSPPSAGKTTMLRDLASSISRDHRRHRDARVLVIDTSNEIGGDTDSPLPYLFRARRVQVPKRSMQLDYMIQAVQNHSPDFVIIDEISTPAEAACAVSLSQRGIRLIATAHASSIESLLANASLNSLVGGVSHAFLSNEERKMKRKVRKTILERSGPSPFGLVVQLQSRDRARVIHDVDAFIDVHLDDKNPYDYEVWRSVGKDVHITPLAPSVAKGRASMGAGAMPLLTGDEVVSVDPDRVDNTDLPLLPSDDQVLPEGRGEAALLVEEDVEVDAAASDRRY